MIFRLRLVEHRHVIHHVVTQRGYELAVRHGVGLLVIAVPSTRPLVAIVPRAVPVVSARVAANELSPPSGAEQIGHAPNEPLNAIGTLRDIDTQAFQILFCRKIILFVGPIILQGRKARRVGLIGRMPRAVELGADASQLSSGRVIQIARDVSGQNPLEHRVGIGVVVIARNEEIIQAVAVIELVVTHRMITVAPRQTLVVIATAFVGGEVFHLVGQGDRRNRCRHRCGISARHHHDRRGLNVKILFVVGSWLLDRFFSGRSRRIFCSLSVFGRSLRGHSVFGFSGVFSRIGMGGSIAVSFADNLGISALSGKGSRGSHAERKRESHARNDDMARRFHRKSPSFCATLASKRAAPHKQNMAERHARRCETCRGARCA